MAYSREIPQVPGKRLARGKPNAIILLKGKSNKVSLSSYIHTHGLAHHPALIREASSFSRQWLIQIHSWPVWRQQETTEC